ncbi:unnamed protein product, partial [Lymnaea stagnalis]
NFKSCIGIHPSLDQTSLSRFPDAEDACPLRVCEEIFQRAQGGVSWCAMRYVWGCEDVFHGVRGGISGGGRRYFRWSKEVFQVEQGGISGGVEQGGISGDVIMRTE